MTTPTEQTSKIQPAGKPIAALASSSLQTPLLKAKVQGYLEQYFREKRAGGSSKLGKTQLELVCSSLLEASRSQEDLLESLARSSLTPEILEALLGEIIQFAFDSKEERTEKEQSFIFACIAKLAEKDKEEEIDLLAAKASFIGAYLGELEGVSEQEAKVFLKVLLKFSVAIDSENNRVAPAPSKELWQRLSSSEKNLIRELFLVYPQIFFKEELRDMRGYGKWFVDNLAGHSYEKSKVLVPNELMGILQKISSEGFYAAASKPERSILQDPASEVYRRAAFENAQFSSQEKEFLLNWAIDKEERLTPEEVYFLKVSARETSFWTETRVGLVLKLYERMLQENTRDGLWTELFSEIAKQLGRGIEEVTGAGLTERRRLKEFLNREVCQRADLSPLEKHFIFNLGLQALQENKRDQEYDKELVSIALNNLLTAEGEVIDEAASEEDKNNLFGIVFELMQRMPLVEEQSALEKFKEDKREIKSKDLQEAGAKRELPVGSSCGLGLPPRASNFVLTSLLQRIHQNLSQELAPPEKLFLATHLSANTYKFFLGSEKPFRACPRKDLVADLHFNLNLIAELGLSDKLTLMSPALREYLFWKGDIPAVEKAEIEKALQAEYGDRVTEALFTKSLDDLKEDYLRNGLPRWLLEKMGSAKGLVEDVSSKEDQALFNLVSEAGDLVSIQEVRVSKERAERHAGCLNKLIEAIAENVSRQEKLEKNIRNLRKGGYEITSEEGSAKRLEREETLGTLYELEVKLELLKDSQNKLNKAYTELYEKYLTISDQHSEVESPEELSAKKALANFGISRSNRPGFREAAKLIWEIANGQAYAKLKSFQWWISAHPREAKLLAGDLSILVSQFNNDPFLTSLSNSLHVGLLVESFLTGNEYSHVTEADKVLSFEEREEAKLGILLCSIARYTPLFLGLAKGAVGLDFTTWFSSIQTSLKGAWEVAKPMFTRGILDKLPSDKSEVVVAVQGALSGQSYHDIMMKKASYDAVRLAGDAYNIVASWTPLARAWEKIKNIAKKQVLCFKASSRLGKTMRVAAQYVAAAACLASGVAILVFFSSLAAVGVSLMAAAASLWFGVDYIITNFFYTTSIEEVLKKERRAEAEEALKKFQQKGKERLEVLIEKEVTTRAEALAQKMGKNKAKWKEFMLNSGAKLDNKSGSYYLEVKVFDSDGSGQVCSRPTGDRVDWPRVSEKGANLSDKEYNALKEAYKNYLNKVIREQFFSTYQNRQVYAILKNGVQDEAAKIKQELKNLSERSDLSLQDKAIAQQAYKEFLKLLEEVPPKEDFPTSAA